MYISVELLNIFKKSVLNDFFLKRSASNQECVFFFSRSHFYLWAIFVTLMAAMMRISLEIHADI